ncbi:MAG: ribosomal subunit Interface protein [Gemmatimonas sp.]|uniref:HPF/RaiA family ribosome-associated protein n=1 Tax=Gemmatimonas sp. UBA7669 TaxID=1946568 RepID=UPI0025B837A0|nr:HPF/RaiA family ribosome-associated protein [Gemmatimonas sp. UBA7669]MBA3917700.1 ribosomal subunit Interface protein [Gemmatimonas sp.]
MLIQVNTVKNLETTPNFLTKVEDDLREALARFGTYVTRVEVHLHDVNADKSGAADKQCVLEARLSGRDPVAVTHAADRLETAWVGARDKLVRLLTRVVDKHRHPKGHDPFDALPA